MCPEMLHPKSSLITLFLLFSGLAAGHPGTVTDSLKAELEQSSGDSSRIRLMLELAMELLQRDSSLAKEYVREARAIAGVHEQRRELGQSSLVMGEIYSYHGAYDEAIREYDRAMAYFSEADADEHYFETTRLKGNVYLFLADYEQAENLYNSALDFYRRNEMHIGVSRCLNNLGVIQRYRGEYGEALSLYEESVIYLDTLKDALDVSQAFINMGNIFVHLGSYEKALEYYQRALEISEREQFLSNIALCLCNSGVVQNKCQNFEEAHRLYRRALRVSETINDQIQISNCLINIGTNYADLENPEEGLEYVQRGMSIKEELGDDRTISNCYIHMAEIHMIMEEYDRAVELFRAAIPVKEELEDREGLVRCYLGIASVMLQREEYDGAERMADQALQIAAEIEAMELQSQAYAMKRDIAVATGDYRSGYRFADLHYRYNDSLLGEATSKAVMEMEFRNRSKALEQENENLKVQTGLQTQLMRKRNAFMYSVLGITLLLATGLALVGYFLRRLRNSSLKLEEQNLVITRQNMKLDQMIRNKDRMMSIMAHDLRGTIGNQLTAVEVLHRTHHEQNESGLDQEKLLVHLKNSASYSLELLENLLHWSRIDESASLYFPEEVDLGILTSNILELFRETAALKKVELHKEMEGPLLCSVDRIMMETTIRNLISNAVKFSDKGGRIHIGAWIDSDELTFRVSDQGVGMTDEQIRKIYSNIGISTRGTANEKGAGIGLALVREFTTIHNGSLRIESEPGKGSAIQVVIPCKK